MKSRSNEITFIKKTIVKFLGVGIVNTIVGYLIYAILVLLNVPYLVSLSIATVAGVTFNYFSIGRLVFKSRSSSATLFKFLTAYGMVYLLNAFMLNMAIKNFQINPYIAQALCVPPSVFSSWILMNYWVYKNDNI